MNPRNTKFWTRDSNGVKELRDLKREHSLWKGRVYSAIKQDLIDEAILIYDEIYDNQIVIRVGEEQQSVRDGCIYQKDECYIRPNDVVLDLGGNIGIFSRFASDAGAKVIYSFEPIIENFELLMLNKPDNCQPHRIAVSDKDNQAIEMTYCPTDAGESSFIIEKYQEIQEKQVVMSMTANTLINNGVIEQPDFIKMDIEGAEILAFNGISDEILSKTRCITMELHNPVLPEEDVLSLYLRLERLGFSVFTLTQKDKCSMVWWVNEKLK